MIRVMTKLHAISSPAPPTDVRAPFARAVITARRAMAGVRPDQLDHPTPCEDFDVRHLLGHLVLVLRRVAAIGRGEGPFSVDDRVAEGGWVDAWMAAAHETQAAWSEDGVLERVVQVPWTEMTGAQALEIYMAEITVHTWDLASATWQTLPWDAEVVLTALAAIQRELPAEGRKAAFEEAAARMPAGPPGRPPFAEAVPVAVSATPLERLVAWSGRQP
jgi:uncharacterized protein (TIGR03086 family)